MKNLQLFSLVFFTFCSLGFASAKTIVANPVCEYHINPIGIDVQKPRFSWQLLSDETNVMQTAYEMRVARTAAGLTKNSDLLWSTGKIMSDQSTNVDYQGTPLTSMQRAYWQVRVWDNRNKVSAWSEPAFWEMGVLETSSWKANWITMKDEKKSATSLPSQYYRNEFAISKKVSSARVYVTSLGLYQLFINGKKVGDQLFTPGFTSYKKRIQYQTYDVTAMLQSKNAIGAIVGDGWYRGYMGWSGRRANYGDKLAILVQLQFNFTDGTSETIITDNNWKSSYGPILESDIYNGETYDARLEMNGWANCNFDDSKWGNVTVLDQRKDVLVASNGLPVKEIQEITPIKIITTPNGETVLDMGQNMVGWVRLKAKGTKGDTITLKFAEVLDKQGNFYTENLRAAKATSQYILKGNGEEIYEPHFTFFGFRYVKVIGFKGTIGLDNITGIVIHSDMKPTGTFSCSDTLINQLQSNIQWGQKGNFLDVPTDCPQRDERLGWTGDAQVFAMTAAYNFDVSAFFSKWLRDVEADQLPDGKIPHVIPNVIGGKACSTAWADVCVIIPWSLYKVYGDKRILEVQYKSMKAWIDYMKQRAGEKYLWLGDEHYGDWLDFSSNKTGLLKGNTDRDLIANAYFYYSTSLFAKIAGIIGKNDDAQIYKQLAENVKYAFQHEFVTPNGRMATQTQTAYSLALAFDLLPENLVNRVGSLLAEDVRKTGHLTTGFVGTPLLCSTLSAIGQDSLAFKLLTRKAYPSWLYPVTQGATTIWERWDGQKPDKTFQSTGMNSFNHYAYGAIGEWMYNYVAGLSIDPENPGYKHILFNPHPGGGLTRAAAELKTMYGIAKSSWKIEGGAFNYEVVIPANTTANITLPKAKSSSIYLNDKSLSEISKQKTKDSGNDVIIELGSGIYHFKYNIE